MADLLTNSSVGYTFDDILLLLRVIHKQLYNLFHGKTAGRSGQDFRVVFLLLFTFLKKDFDMFRILFVLGLICKYDMTCAVENVNNCSACNVIC